MVALKEVETIIQSELEKMKTSIINKLTAVINEKFQVLDENITRVEKKFDESLAALMERVAVLENDNMVLRKIQAKDVVARLDLEIHCRKNNVIIPNIEESADRDSETTEQLITKFKNILKQCLKMNPEYVDSMTFKAAHRLQAKKDARQPRSTIIVFDRSYHAQDTWREIKKLSGKCKYHFKSHLPTELANYKSDLLKDRSEMKENHPELVVRVVEVKGYPQIEIKDNGKWVKQRGFKDRFGDLLKSSNE